MSETVHGTAVLVGALGLLIRGRPGSGKSSLALHFIQQGARLIADDRVHLSACHGRLIASAPYALAGKLELRGRGILTVPHERSAVIRLVIDHVPEEELERLPDAHYLQCDMLGVALPRQPVTSALPRAAMLAEAALADLSHCNMSLRTARVWG